VAPSDMASLDDLMDAETYEASVED
jgi:hypothetical protein